MDMRLLSQVQWCSQAWSCLGICSQVREEWHFQHYTQNAHSISGLCLGALCDSMPQGCGGQALAYIFLCQIRGKAYPVMILEVLGAWAAMMAKYSHVHYHTKPSLVFSKMLSSYLCGFLLCYTPNHWTISSGN